MAHLTHIPKRRIVRTPRQALRGLDAMADWLREKAAGSAPVTHAEVDRFIELVAQVEVNVATYGDARYDAAKYELIPLFPEETT